MASRLSIVIVVGLLMVANIYTAITAANTTNYLGCYFDVRYNSYLPLGLIASNDMTIGLCINHCLDFESSSVVRYAGVRSSVECSCGDEDVEFSPSDKRDDGQLGHCRSPCAGDQSQTCGNSAYAFYFQVYDLTLLRCELRLFPNGGVTSDSEDNVQIRMFASFSCNPGYELIGQNHLQCIVENSNVAKWNAPLPECQEVPSSPTPSKHTTTTTSRSPTTTSRSPTTTSRSPTTTSRSTRRETSKILTNPVQQDATTASYIGCFYDYYPEPTRVLAFGGIETKDMTIGLCINHCLDLANTSLMIRYAGLEAGNECWCGEEDAQYWQNGQRHDEACSTPCAGDNNQTCGAYFHIQVYDLTYRPSSPTLSTSQFTTARRIKNKITGTVVGVAVGSLLFFILIVVLLLGLYFYKTRKSVPSDETQDIDVYEILTQSTQTPGNQTISNQADLTDSETYSGLRRPDNQIQYTGL